LVDLVAAQEQTTLSDATKGEIFGKVLARRERHRSSAPLFLRPAVAFGILLVAGATTAATLGHHWIAEKLHLGAPAATPAPALQPAARPAPQHETRIAAPEPAVVPTVPTVPAVEDSPSLPLAGPAKRPHAHPGRSEDPSRIVAAIQALRNDHDPDRAAKLLAEYLKIYPRGALAEEGLALSIEAAAAQHNPTAASAFAERYLKEYPNGRFRPAAERARRTPGP
jgi:hypothetical protein